MDPVAPHGQRDPSGASDPAPLLVSVVALGTVAAQLAFRAADDSRLTSWRWVFAGTDPVRLFALVAAAIGVAHLLARSPLPARRPTPLLFLLSFAAAACFWPAPEVIVDASRYFTQAKHLELHGLRWFLSEWGREIPAWTDLPLVPALYGLVFRLFGEARIHAQLLGTLLFAGSVVLTYRTGAELFDEDVGLAGAAFLLAIPYLLTQVPSMLVDVPTMFFLVLATYAVLHAVRRGGAARILLASIAVFLAALSKYSAWLLLTGLPAIAVVHRGRWPGALGRAAAQGRGVEHDRVAARGRDGITGGRRRGDIGYASLRGGNVVGDHTVVFAADNERVELSHKAADRAIFARGAVRAALWAKGRAPGRYDMFDVLGLPR